MPDSPSRPVHLLGSVPLEDAAAVFELVGQTLGPLVERAPDGETGARANWIGWQHRVFADQDALEPSVERERDYQLNPPYRFRPGTGPADLEFGAPDLSSGVFWLGRPGLRIRYRRPSRHACCRRFLFSTRSRSDDTRIAGCGFA